MKKNFKYGIPLLLALSLSIIPFNVSKAETIEEKELVTYDEPDFDQLLLDDFNNQNLEVSNYAIESEKYFDDGNDLIVEEEHIDNSESSKENLEEKDALENDIKYKVQEDNENPNKPRNKKIEEKISNMTLDEKIGQMLMLEFRNWEDKNGELKEVTELNDDI